MTARWLLVAIFSAAGAFGCKTAEKQLQVDEPAVAAAPSGRVSETAPPPDAEPGSALQVRARDLRARLPGHFAIVVEEPFVVIGNGGEEWVRERATSTVRWAVSHLKRDFFSRDPDRIIDVWLFVDDDSYRRYARELFGDEPSTPYGYYSSDDDALVMNISTGGGTLVHEIVHPFMEVNFPACPAWFNEGMGSLYEQSGSRDGRIVGFTNWRLAGLQSQIDAGTLPTLKEMMSTTTEEFYAGVRGDNYAQARYLLYYLQEKGLLRRYYRQFVATAAEDPTGYQTLLRVLDIDDKDMPAFERRWRAFVMRLRFP